MNPNYPQYPPSNPQLSPDQLRANRLKLLGLMAAGVVGLGIIALLAFGIINGGKKDSGKFVTDPISNQTVFSDPNQTPEQGGELLLPMQGTQKLYSEVNSAQFMVIRNTLDAYVRSKVGEIGNNRAYILNGDTTKDGENITFNVNVSPADLNFQVRVTINPTGKLSLFIDGAEFNAANFSETPDDPSSSDPLLASLPYQTNHFKINYAYTDPNTKTGPILSIKLFASNTKPDPAIKAIYEQDLKDYREEALNYIRSKGVDPANYAIFYSPDPDNPYIDQH